MEEKECNWETDAKIVSNWIKLRTPSIKSCVCKVNFFSFLLADSNLCSAGSVPGTTTMYKIPYVFAG